MRVLSLYPEWAWAICYLGKDVENRFWTPTKDLYRESGFTLAIQASKIIGGVKNRAVQKDSIYKLFATAKRAGWRILRRDGRSFFFSRIDLDFFKEIRIVFNADEIPKGKIVALTSVKECIKNSNSPWAEANYHNWVLGNVYRVKTPISCIGRQRLFYLPSDIRDELVKELRG